MSLSEKTQQVVRPTEQKSQTYLIGSILGLTIGFLAAYFYVRAAEESENNTGLQATDFIKIALALLGLVRQMTEMGTGKKK